MNPMRYIISLRIFHPKKSAKEIIDEIGMQAKVSHSVGHERRTPKGTKLDGLYDKTYVLFPLSTGKSVAFEDALRSDISGLIERHANTFAKITGSGGSIEFFIGIFMEGNSGIVLDPQLLALFANSSVALSFDLYPED